MSEIDVNSKHANSVECQYSTAAKQFEPLSQQFVITHCQLIVHCTFSWLSYISLVSPGGQD
jgi:hypothetical protein